LRRGLGVSKLSPSNGSELANGIEPDIC